MTSEPLVMLNHAEVVRRTALSRSAIFELVRQGDFPAPVRLTPKRVGYVESEVTAWLDSRIAASRGEALNPKD